MKRSYDEIDDEDSTKKIKESDMEILQEVQDKLTQTNNEINKELEFAKQKYYVSYFKKAMEKLPICNDIIDTSTITDSYEGFLKTYSIAKTCVNAEIELKKMLAFNSIYDMITSVLGKCIHESVISPYLKLFVSPKNLENAYSIYQNELLFQEDANSTELHCISYLIQKEIEKKECMKIPNPMYNKCTQQLTALSKYITEILKSIAFKHIKNEE